MKNKLPGIQIGMMCGSPGAEFLACPLCMNLADPKHLVCHILNTIVLYSFLGGGCMIEGCHCLG